MNGGNAVHLSNLKIVNACLAFDVCSGKSHRVSESAAFVISKRQIPLGALITSYSQRTKYRQLSLRGTRRYPNTIQREASA
jgi:hypothetical protein